MKDERVGVGIGCIIVHDNKLLMLQRGSGTSHGQGLWSIPGGWVNWGETPEQAAIRELYEETGLHGINPRYVGTVTNTYDEEKLHVVDQIFVLDVEYYEPVNMERDKAISVEWVPLDTVSNLNLFPPLKQFLETYGSFLRPKIVCLCGSTRFHSEFRKQNLALTMRGYIVLTIGCDTKSDHELEQAQELTKENLLSVGDLHLRKIDLADEILVLNVGGYVGDSTRNEIAYAVKHNKTVRYLE